MPETPDIVERLRDPNAYGNVPICREAARTIELLRAEVEAWRTRPGHDRQRTCYEGDGWDRVRVAVAATDAAGALGRKP